MAAPTAKIILNSAMHTERCMGRQRHYIFFREEMTHPLASAPHDRSRDASLGGKAGDTK